MKFDFFLQDRTILENGYGAVHPTVSIIMPTYSRMAEGFLERCINSVLSQQFANFEFIIIDDGSTDGSQELITRYAKNDPRIVYVRHNDNSGLPAVRTNEGILLARAPYISFIFDDNVWESNALSIMMESMVENPVDVLHANTAMIVDGKDDFELGAWPLSIELLQHLNTIPNGTVLCKRSFFQKVGLYDPHLILRRVCDWDLWLRGVRLGAKFRHINTTLGIELGPSSPISLGNSVKMDYKVVFAYMTDELQIISRSKALWPEQISQYDVFDPLKVFPYIRDESEWMNVQTSVYVPFFSAHPNYHYVPPPIENRRYEIRDDPYSLNACHSLFKDKKRALIVSNRFSPLVEDWKDSFEKSLGAITITSSEWQASAFLPEELDYLILIDCSALFLKPFVAACRHQGVPVGYVVMHGMDAPIQEGHPLERLTLGTDKKVFEIFKTEIYFPHFGIPWQKGAVEGAEALMKIADQVFVMGRDAGAQPLVEGVTGVGLPYVSRIACLNKPLLAADAPVCPSISFYLGMPEQLSPASIAKVVSFARAVVGMYDVKIVVFRGCDIPKDMRLSAEIVRCIEVSDETLMTRARHAQKNSTVFVPDTILQHLDPYSALFLEDELAQNESVLFALSELPDVRSLEITSWLLEQHAKKLGGVIARKAEFSDGCRLTQFACASSSLRFKKLLEQSQPTGSSPHIAVLLNSPLLSGSEAYGLLLVRALTRLGYRVTTCVPRQHGYGEVRPDDINKWLKNIGLTDAVEINYGISTECFSAPMDACIAQGRLINDWLDAQGVQMVICSAFIPEPLLARSATDRPVFLALFQPWGYPLQQMTFLRNRVTGVLSDSEWAASHWARWLPPPVDVVPTYVSAAQGKQLNKALPDLPICIAVGGTLQPRKRQKEALEAVRLLIAEGYDVRLNIYGYELAILSNYVEEIRQVIESSQLGSVVEFHGLVEIDEIARNNHIILSSSLDESLPQTLLFLMAAGLIAVACPAGGVPEIVIDGKTGYLCRAFAVSDLHEGLKRAIESRSDWGKIRSQAHTLLLSRHAELTVCKKLFSSLIEGLVIKNSPGKKLFPLASKSGIKTIRYFAATSLRKRLENKISSVKLRLIYYAKPRISPYLSKKTKARIMRSLQLLKIL